MKHLNNWKLFYIINEEWSKNYPIQELSQKERLGIVLLGTPGAGKSTFFKKVISPVNRNIKSFSTDDVSLKFTKNPKYYKQGASELNLAYLTNYIETGQNFVYDTTGVNQKPVFDVCKKAKKNGYTIIFILILIDIQKSKEFNIERGLMGHHQADDDYIEFVYNSQNQTTKNYIKLLKPESFYIVLNRGVDRSYKYYKHTGKEILKKKIDKYIPLKK
jgi:predicted ABC-type ATPase